MRTRSDKSVEGMWLFDNKIANLRKVHAFLVKIETHRDYDVAGRRVGKVLPDANAPSHPLRLSSSVVVKVEYKNAKGDVVVEDIPATNLSPGQLKSKARMAIIKGDRVGDIVMHVKTDGPDARVYPEGDSSKNGFRVPKSNLCVIE